MKRTPPIKKSAPLSCLSLLLLGLAVAGCGGGGGSSSSSPTTPETPSTPETPTTPETPNQAPVADAGDDQVVAVGVEVTLSGAASEDADSDPLSYSWQLAQRPDGSSASIDNPTLVTATITPDVAGIYLIELIVSDGELQSALDTVQVEANQETVVVSSPVVDTGQRRCFSSAGGIETSCSGMGYDADYSGNQANYSLSAAGTVVIDEVTGLVWTQSTDTNGDGQVNVSDKLSPANAAAYCQGLELAQRSDWRLPSIKEAYSLIAFTGEDPSGYNGTDTTGLIPFIDPIFDWVFGDQAAGERIIDGQYATTTEYVSRTMNNSETMFGVNFVDGRIKGYPLNNKSYYVRCVAGDEYGLNDLVNNGDDTVSDHATGLMWQRNDVQSDNWDDAIAICEHASIAGYDDWRLPNIKELHSIVDYSRSPDTHASAAIDPIFNATSFINEEGETDWGAYWSATTHISYGGRGHAAAYINFGRSLGYMNQLLDVHGAGAQRSDDKDDASNGGNVPSQDLGYGSFYYRGPQGDIVKNDHWVRCVRTHQPSTAEQAIATDGSVNILLIIGDDIGVDNVSGYGEHGDHSAQTPTIDQLASSGVLFRNVWANPMCSPSRASLLTGRHALRHGVFSPGRLGELDASEYTIAEALSDAGYATALFGKWHLGTRQASLPTSQGFDYYSGSLENIDDYFNWQKTTLVGADAAKTDPVIETGYATDVVAAEAAEWIASVSQPWFVQLAFNAPHSPFHVPPEGSYSAVNLTGQPGDGCSRNNQDDSVTDCYRAMAEAMDSAIGQLLAEMDAATRANTLVIFLGDNGTSGAAVIEDSAYPFTAAHAKGTVYEGGVNVPLVIAAGSNIGIDGGEVDALIQIQDLYPTLLAIGNATSSQDVDGLSLLGHIDAQAPAAQRHQQLYSELYEESVTDRWAVSDGSAKYISNEGVEECYDLANDAAEATNLFASGNEVDVRCNALKQARPQ
ncbi:sulfatase-like hydrolase/transferase [Neiella sp. HB171785]|uniref:Sulfatase-like hydrolase/transferase n=1 Tax=Neiella litorisoli TaxID=2771431 RepID=A0A8J6UMT7_9GAMM|nr:sulfatase-like hydrolase/transferase [Neiella litorisoli]MBD1391125.1 sulfatase-like hydrolase/transferase [Neiella litorisoli]